MSVAPQVECILLGGGGHARVLIDCLRASGVTWTLAVLDRNPSLWGVKLQGVPVVGGDDFLPELARRGTAYFVVGLGGVGDNRPRRRLFDLALVHGLRPVTVRHPSAILSPWATFGEGSVLCPNAVVNANAYVGKNVIVNTGAIVEHDCVVGDHVHVATGSRLCSTVRVGIGAHIGAGATIRQCVTVGEGAVVGAGAVVVKEVNPWTVVAGVPARPLERHTAIGILPVT